MDGPSKPSHSHPNLEAKKREDIQVLKDMIEYYEHNDVYPLSGVCDLKDFYEGLFGERIHIYPSPKHLDDRIHELETKFLITDAHVVGDMMDALDIQIFNLSKKIWKHEDETDPSSPHLSISSADSSGACSTTELDG
ncbi:hypothetical protein L6452_13657 [Arctium lappa]|uniref:Uncharacterized protein n=1 Tax=Arctium lappa TaxID=4217 RepID=A0ACB9CJ54_ARCLA|nr:hypothetical protein L6452_13657 [Arctium lappa]